MASYLWKRNTRKYANRLIEAGQVTCHHQQPNVSYQKVGRWPRLRLTIAAIIAPETFLILPAAQDQSWCAAVE